jgi:hypothetical protein
MAIKVGYGQKVPLRLFLAREEAAICGGSGFLDSRIS